MARVTHVKKAQKDHPAAGIKKGESYYWWKFKRGGKHYSKTPPKRSQLTQSNFYSQIYALEDDIIAKAEANDGLEGVRDDVVQTLNDIKSECEDSLSNMPDGLQQGSSGELLQERIDAMDSTINEFESLEFGSFEATRGSEVLDEQKEKDGEHEDKCGECHEEERHTLECKHHVADEGVNDDDQTEQEYWEAKLEEFQAVSIEAP